MGGGARERGGAGRKWEKGAFEVWGWSRETERQTDRQTDRQKNKQTDRERNRDNNGQPTSLSNRERMEAGGRGCQGMRKKGGKEKKLVTHHHH